jgi:hypothetical protein
MSFLDPYSKNRRVPLAWLGRAVLLLIAAAITVMAWRVLAG